MMKRQPLADMRGITFVNDEGVRYYTRKVGSTCERCGISESCMASSLKTGASIHKCETFRPILLFVNSKGMKAEFNTIRLGSAWSKRVIEGSLVSLRDKHRIFGHAVVTKVLFGDKHEMLEQAAQCNHMLIDENLSKDKALERIKHIVKNAYGGMIWKHNDQATVIYVKRLE